MHKRSIAFILQHFWLRRVLKGKGDSSTELSHLLGHRCVLLFLTCC